MQEDRSRPGQIMQMKEEDRPGLPLVEAYGGYGFTIFGRRRAAPLMLTLDGCHGLDIESLTDIGRGELSPLVEATAPPDLLIIGTGREMQSPPEGLATLLGDIGLAFEPMDSAAAARTFNTLLLEDRHVAALLMPI